MKYVQLGNVSASRVVMGCMRIADKPLQQTEQLIVEAVRSGVNMFDLADVYAAGDCERIFGVAMRDLGIARADYVLQTKCGIRKNTTGKWFDFSAEHIVNSVDNSLIRLNTDYIDVFLLHRPDALVEADEVAEAFEKVKALGKVRAFGVSNMSAGQMRYLQNAGVEIVANQIQFSLGHTLPVDAGFFVNMTADQAVTRAGDVVDYCREKNIALQAWSPFQYGFFEGVFVGNPKFPLLNAQLEKTAEKYGVSVNTVAVAWILRHPAFKQVISGTTNPERMRQMCVAADVVLSKEDWYDLYAATGKELP